MTILINIFIVVALGLLILIILGFFKFLLGFCSGISKWGLTTLLEGTEIVDDDYTDKSPDVCTNDRCDKFTDEKTFKLCSRKVEFLLNLTFFMTYPIIACHSFFKKYTTSNKCCRRELVQINLIDRRDESYTEIESQTIQIESYGEKNESQIEQDDTHYVLNEFSKSKESLINYPEKFQKKISNKKLLLKEESGRKKSRDESSDEAKNFVKSLINCQIVYRKLNQPLEKMIIPTGVEYYVKGYFLKLNDCCDYKFISILPAQQFWTVSKIDSKAIELESPLLLDHKIFDKCYETAQHVYDTNDLSLTPKGVCVNVK